MMLWCLDFVRVGVFVCLFGGVWVLFCVGMIGDVCVLGVLDVCCGGVCIV